MADKAARPMAPSMTMTSLRQWSWSHTRRTATAARPLPTQPFRAAFSTPLGLRDALVPFGFLISSIAWLHCCGRISQRPDILFEKASHETHHLHHSSPRQQADQVPPISHDSRQYVRYHHPLQDLPYRPKVPPSGRPPAALKKQLRPLPR
ncbi:hypothetical protein K456DRAFT_1516645 [Colletotrichum gloeosporioides 23]|nr:hypothetical protein K456DRAFT_1516645 [Colletotrichum gloeosporioides 23]